MNLDKFFMKIAWDVANKSNEPSTKVGCVIVDEENNIIATGCNDYVMERGSKYSTDKKPIRYLISIHAEMRALINNIPDASERHKNLGHKILDVVAIIYDKVAENYDFKIVKIPLEICHKNAVIPTYAHDDDAGFDFYLPELKIEAHQTVIAKVGLKMAIPVGYELQIRPRSGLSFKTGLRVANAPGTVDSGYRDEIGIICWNTSDEKIILKAGERIAQGVLNEIPRGQFHIVEDITKVVGSNRNGGFGSSGK